MELPTTNNDELVTCLAALALYDGEAEITAAQISALLAATNNTAAPYFPMLFANYLKNNIESLVFSLGGAGAAAAAPAAGGAPAAAAGKEEKKEEKKKEQVEEVSLAGGFDMFGGGGGGGDY